MQPSSILFPEAICETESDDFRVADMPPAFFDPFRSSGVLSRSLMMRRPGQVNPRTLGDELAVGSWPLRRGQPPEENQFFLVKTVAFFVPNRFLRDRFSTRY